MVGSKKVIIPEMVKVGRITQPIAKVSGIKSAYIYLSRYYIRHITRYHGTEIERLGFSAELYVKSIVQNFNEIRQGTNGSYLLVFRCENNNNVAAIDITIASNGNYEVKTAQPRAIGKIEYLPLLWKAQKKPTVKQ